VDEWDDYADPDLAPPWRPPSAFEPLLVGFGVLAVIGSGMALVVFVLLWLLD
jgi:hypothetical protein